MRTDPSVIALMEAAVEKEPDNKALRLHLAKLYMDADRPGEALGHCAYILQSNTADQDVIEFLNEHRPSSAKEAQTQVGVNDDVAEVETPKDSLKEVAGLEDVKRRLELSFFAPMRNPEMQKLYGKSIQGGLLLYGPPGCGKTFIARAIAAELKAKFISIAIIDVIDCYYGRSEKNLHAVFQTARRNAPCVVFIDEVDALGRKRSQLRETWVRTVVNQLLAELDGVDTDNKGVFVIGATNHPWDVDSALRRPGRFDRTILVLPPDDAARRAILQSHLNERPVEALDLDWITQHTQDYSGADLVHLCDSAAELAMEDALNTGAVRPIRMADFKRALREVKPSIMPWLETARNHVLYANEGGMYDPLADYLKRRNLL